MPLTPWQARRFPGEEDSINGASGTDSINALGGNDTLNGGSGADTMAGPRATISISSTAAATC
jgi:Ca2+-binding RTX toxin-like protein